jgi:hypothetical protein
MFAFLSTLVICATVVFLAIKQPTIKIETSQKREPIFVPAPEKADDSLNPAETQDTDALEAMLGDITELFTGGDHVNENTNATG